ncbi:hypothetical protein V6N12_060960 [Hibiscus sabdariffa]|uniref:Uncharacterized protein n=1 Tax=Hibiscus sabdariffa TaxID=183260 RepID=A0ABR2DW38_9ROSI
MILFLYLLIDFQPFWLLRSSIEPLGSFQPAINTLLQLWVPVLESGYQYSPEKSTLKNMTVVRGVLVLQSEYQYARHMYRYGHSVPVRALDTGVLQIVSATCEYRYAQGRTGTRGRVPVLRSSIDTVSRH